MIKNIIWIIVIILGIIYLFKDNLIYFIKKIRLSLKVKHIRKSIIQMEVIDKYYIKGNIEMVGGNRVPSKYPDSYIIELKYENLLHKINDKEMFNNLYIGCKLEFELVEKLDKYENILSYKLNCIYK